VVVFLVVFVVVVVPGSFHRQISAYPAHLKSKFHRCNVQLLFFFEIFQQPFDVTREPNPCRRRRRRDTCLMMNFRSNRVRRNFNKIAPARDRQLSLSGSEGEHSPDDDSLLLLLAVDDESSIIVMLMMRVR